MMQEHQAQLEIQEQQINLQLPDQNGISRNIGLRISKQTIRKRARTIYEVNQV
jgi:hypothetical protein